ncbi:metallophosphoesterase family protein [Desulfosudis oleivorans]|uniref:Metallophosphoesterase n=1 Tax=Desulfosudis oleivorans (strain DSM 6200 / JCM 39069 / Hxd3) TaxID=96561 RepID=A8ZUB4_DESOH|nr:metallophosphoesterase [Desulfosudis oleivorans]ABW67946.1 metallophosphoesterase [Desulfosudis oleivorans Hxd3]
MIILGCADIHGRTVAVDPMAEVLQSADVVVLVGDVTNFGRQAEAMAVVDAFEHHGARVLAVPGNCDFPEVGQVFSSRGINIHGDCRVVNGVGFVGLGGSLVTPFGTPGEYSEAELEGVLNQAAARLPEGLPFVLVSHQPPIHTLCDRLSNGTHVGSHAVRRFIETRRPLACFTGHIHEACGMDTIGDTSIVNPGLFANGRYAHGTVSGQGVELTIRMV